MSYLLYLLSKASGGNTGFNLGHKLRCTKNEIMRVGIRYLLGNQESKRIIAKRGDVAIGGGAVATFLESTMRLELSGGNTKANSISALLLEMNNAF